MRAKQIMTQDVATIRGSASVAEAVRLMRLKGLRALIVEPRHSADTYGIVTVADIAGKVIAYGKDSDSVRVYEIMSKPCITVDPDLDVEYVARLLSNNNLWCAPVIRGELMGVISITDIVSKGDFIAKPKLTFLRKELHKAISDARGISANYGADSKRSVEAWDLVDELETEACFYGLPKPDKSARELFADKPELVPVG